MTSCGHPSPPYIGFEVFPLLHFLQPAHQLAPTKVATLSKFGWFRKDVRIERRAILSPQQGHMQFHLHPFSVPARSYLKDDLMGWRTLGRQIHVSQLGGKETFVFIVEAFDECSQGFPLLSHRFAWFAVLF